MGDSLSYLDNLLVRQNAQLFGQRRKIEFSCMYLSVDTNLPPSPPPKKREISKGRMTSSPLLSMYFPSSVATAHYCGLSSIGRDYCGL